MYKIFRLIKTERHIFRSLHISRIYNENHYEVLKLPKDCTKREIKNAFIKLSKKYHPDKNKLTDTHEKFIRLSEAYYTLSDPVLRQSYDLSLSNPNYVNVYHNQSVYNAKRRQWSDPSFWENRDKSQDKYYESKPYYGIEGLKRVSNKIILFVILVVATVGVGLQAFAIKYSLAFNRERLDAKSAENYRILNEIKARAEKNGTEKQIELLKLNLQNTGRLPKE